MKTRVRYFFVICFVIFLGLFSRKLDFVPLFVGDILYAMMMYFIVRIFFLRLPSIKIASIALAICFSIELLQLYQADWIVEIRNSTLGHFVLGQGFLWSDLVAYTFGIAVSYALEKLLFNGTITRNIIRK